MLFTSVQITCGTDTLIVYDENRNSLYDYCASTKASSNNIYIVREAKYLIIRTTVKSKNKLTASYSFNLFDTETSPFASSTTQSMSSTTPSYIPDDVFPKGYLSLNSSNALVLLISSF